jgi:hypothetical protein
MATETTTTSEGRVTGLHAGIQLAFGVIWLVATMWAANASIMANADDAPVALGSAAAALPGVIAASLFAGACAGLVASRRVYTRVLPRVLWGLGGGVLFGGLAAAAILFGYGTNSSISTLAVTVGVAGALGGAAAGLPPRVLAAGLAGASAVFLAGALLGALQPQLSNLFGGGGSDVAARASASTSVAYLQSAIAGVLAGILAYRSLRRNPPPWPWFLAAGALPGLLLLVAEGLTHVGGASLQNIVKGFSPFDEALVEFTDFARFRHALVVLFVGGIVAMIAVGRTLNRPADPDEDADA